MRGGPYLVALLDLGLGCAAEDCDGVVGLLHDRELGEV